MGLRMSEVPTITSHLAILANRAGVANLNHPAFRATAESAVASPQKAPAWQAHPITAWGEAPVTVPTHPAAPPGRDIP